MFHGRTKHIKIRYHYIRELVSEGTLSLKNIIGAKNPADMLTKFRGMIYSLAKDHNGCRLLQGKFENPMNEEIEMVLYKVLDSIRELMTDQFGNYLIQNLITVCNDDHKLRILLSLTDVHVPYENGSYLTRAMQKLLEKLNDPYQIVLAMAALRLGAARLANDPNGHHVIQYCLIHFPSDVNEPILNDIAGKFYDVATDRSGCCVLQACIEHSQGEVKTHLVAEIMANAIHLAEDPYGFVYLKFLSCFKLVCYASLRLTSLSWLETTCCNIWSG
ncbi:pumilio homolog 12-like protein [Tanacetum coccineum]